MLPLFLQYFTNAEYMFISSSVTLKLTLIVPKNLVCVSSLP